MLAVATGVAVADQVTKQLIVSNIGPASTIHAIDLAGPWLRFEYAENRGIAFGLFPALGSVVPFLMIAIVALLLIHFAREVSPPRWEAVAIGAICGGAAGNLIDRLRLGYVVDFISVGPWPNFNLADSAITLGSLALVWGWLRSGDREQAASNG
jgi:signal peptidase II